MTAVEPYRTSPIKPLRRSKDDIEQLKAELYEVVRADQPMTVRQVFYQMVSRGAIDKTENEYKHTVCRLLKDMRLERELPFGWIADNTRAMRKPLTFSSLDRALQRWAESYRKDLWDNQDAYVQIWLEKDALSGVLFDITGVWDVPLMVTRGYASLSFLYSAAEEISIVDKPVFLYYFGDYDPSGMDIARVTEATLRKFAPEADITWERMAVNPDQITEFTLLTRPTKSTDSRSKGFQGGSVEVDAIPPAALRRMAESCITQHIDEQAYHGTCVAEQSEREIVQRMVNERYYRSPNQEAPGE